MARRLVGLVLPLATLLAAAPARAGDVSANAKTHFELGSQFYQQGRYDDALAELTLGYQLDPRPEFLYSLGQTERKRGHCKEALDYYQRYLESGLVRERATAVLIQMDRCRAELAHPTEPAPAPVPATIVIAPTLPPVAPPLAVAPPPRRVPVYKRWWLWTTVGVVAAVGIGVGLGVGLTAGHTSDFKPTLPDLVLR